MSIIKEDDDVGIVFERELINQELRKLICGWKSRLWLAATEKLDY